jgi:hypothetical protein
MGEYTNDLMMAIVVTTTALIAMTAVILGQVAQSKLEVSGKRSVSRILWVTIFCGVIALWLSISWFMFPNDILLFIIFPIILFLSELGLLIGASIAFWNISLELEDMSKQKESPNKPTTGSKRPRK